nr:MAG TPA: hypothetical protein [Caudoviricetes sp.]
MVNPLCLNASVAFLLRFPLRQKKITFPSNLAISSA